MPLRTTANRLLRSFEQSFYTHNRIEVSKSALQHNLHLFQKDVLVIPVLKGNAYGHGIEQVAEALKDESVAYIAVDGYFEALRIRAVSKQPVLIMGAIKPVNYQKLKYNNFAFVVDSLPTIAALAQTSRSVKVHLEFNTGMNRYGADPEHAAELTHAILKADNLELEGVMSHLADSDGNDPEAISRAVGLFDECVRAVRAAGGKPTYIHVAQTAGSFVAHSEFANAARIGIGLYGINPFSLDHRLHKQLAGLKPALQLVSTIAELHKLSRGDAVSYNYTFYAKQSMKVGVLPLGYYEGVDRALSNKGWVKLGDHFAPVVGRICMNHTMIDVSGCKAQVGDEVTVISSAPNDKNAIDSTAAELGLFNYSMLTGLSSDVRRVLVN